MILDREQLKRIKEGSFVPVQSAEQLLPAQQELKDRLATPEVISPEQQQLHQARWVLPKVRSKVFCALCSKERPRRLDRPTLSLVNYGQLMLFVLILSALFSMWLPFWGSFAFFAFFGLMMFDFLKRSLYRQFAACPFCGFDPLLYRKDRKQAKTKIQEHIQLLQRKAVHSSLPQKN